MYTQIIYSGFSPVYQQGFVIYGDGEIKWETSRGYIEKKGICGERIKSFNLSTEPKRAIKENLNRKDNYYIKGRLYIHQSEVAVLRKEEVVHHETKLDTTYIDEYTLNFIHGYSYQSMVRREVTKDYVFANEQEKKNYFSNKDGTRHFIKEYVNVVENELITTCDYVTRTVKSEKGEEVDKIVEIISKCTYNSVSRYDVEKMLQVLDIKIK